MRPMKSIGEASQVEIHVELNVLRAVGAGFRQPIDHALARAAPARALGAESGACASHRCLVESSPVMFQYVSELIAQGQ